jgi:hypothetical protein
MVIQSNNIIHIIQPTLFSGFIIFKQNYVGGTGKAGGLSVGHSRVLVAPEGAPTGVDRNLRAMGFDNHGFPLEFIPAKAGTGGADSAATGSRGHEKG